MFNMAVGKYSVAWNFQTLFLIALLPRYAEQLFKFTQPTGSRASCF